MLIVAGVVIRAGVFAPDTVRDLLGPDEQNEPRPPIPVRAACVSRPVRVAASPAVAGRPRSVGTARTGRSVGTSSRSGTRHASGGGPRTIGPAGAARPTSTTSCRRSWAARMDRRTCSHCARGIIGRRRRPRIDGGAPRTSGHDDGSSRGHGPGPPARQSSSSPRSASTPSRTRSTTMPRAASGSAHHQPNAALSASPLSVTSERYQQA